MRVGVALEKLDSAVEDAQVAEALGFDYVHVGEHLFFNGPTPNAFVVLSAAAAVTQRIGLLSAVTLLPLYPAVTVAKLAGVLDTMSGGRFNLGVGVGGENPREFAAAGVPVRERGRRADEGLEIISRLFSGEPTSFRGTWADLDELQLDPPASPPIWIAGRKPAGMRRAARYADYWMPYMITPERLADGLEFIRAEATSAGRSPEAVRGAFYGFVAIDHDGDRARTWAVDQVSRIYGQDFSKLQHYLVAGAPEECVQRLLEYETAGADAAQLSIACPSEHRAAVRELLAREVVPQLRSN